ncbi:reverse transcriptase family protein, partial [Metarhizium majus ARSEF 297]
MAADGLDASSRVILKGSGNWDVWISVIRKFAKNQQVWDYINPDVVQKPSLTSPVEPTPGQVQENAAEIQQLQGDSLSKFQILEARHRSQLQIYKDKTKALATLQEYIVKTVGKYYDIIAKEDDIAKELTILKNRVKPTDWTRESEVTDRYYATLKEVSRTKVETCMDLEMASLRPTRHFLKAVNAIDPTFSKVWINQMEANALSHEDAEWQKTFPDGIKISEIFERSCRSTAQSANITGAFATFQGEGESDASKPNSKNPGGKPICLCGRRHFYAECYYLSDSVQPAGWSPDNKVQEEINQKLQDPIIKGKVERSIRNRKKKEDQPQQQNESGVKGTAFAGAVAKAQPEDTQPTQDLSDKQTQSTFSTTAVYPLRDSFILDSGSDFHICNNSKRFVEGSYKVCDNTEGAYSGDTHLEIHGYGDVIIRIGKTDKFKL